MPNAMLFISLFAALLLVGVLAFVAMRWGGSAQGDGEQSGGERHAAFGDLSGQGLWQAMNGQSMPGWSPEAIGQLRTRYEFILRSHIRELFEEGLFDARGGSQGQLNNPLLISTLRGSVMSWIPPNHAETIYLSGFRCAAMSHGELQQLGESLDKACSALYRAAGLEPTSKYSTALIPRFRQQEADSSSSVQSNTPTGEQSQPVTEAEPPASSASAKTPPAAQP